MKQGFQKHRTLKHIKPNHYDYEWKPLISYFQLQMSELAPEFNRRYGSDMTPLDERGAHPYYLPIGWYRHALRVIDKYPHDQKWLGHANLSGEWPVAYHGTHEIAVKGIVQQGLLIGKSKPGGTTADVMRADSIEEKGQEFDRPGLYVATHCDGGAHPRYTHIFKIKGPEAMKKGYRVVFQCRVQPGAFSTHEGPVVKGHAWRFVDPEAIRPYGLLIKTESVSP